MSPLSHPSNGINNTTIKQEIIIDILSRKQDTSSNTHTHTHTHIHIYIYICVCVCVCARTRFKRNRSTREFVFKLVLRLQGVKDLF